MSPWRDDHPICSDPALAPFADAAARLVGAPAEVTLLRHLVGRRATSLVTTPADRRVLKVFAGPRARGNHRRLIELRDRLGSLVPASLGVDPEGHVSLLGWQSGTAFDELDDTGFVAAAGPAGAALGALHRCGGELDRVWGLDREIEQLQRRATARTADAVDDVVRSARYDQLRHEPLVPAHRDAHPRQIVVTGEGDVAFIDLDDAAMAPAGLDVGNFVGHLRREAVLGRRSADVAGAAIDAFLDGYGELPPTWTDWEDLTLLRLVGLAESRHARTDWAVALDLLRAERRAGRGACSGAR